MHYELQFSAGIDGDHWRVTEGHIRHHPRQYLPGLSAQIATLSKIHTCLLDGTQEL